MHPRDILYRLKGILGYLRVSFKHTEASDVQGYSLSILDVFSGILDVLFKHLRGILKHIEALGALGGILRYLRCTL